MKRFTLGPRARFREKESRRVLKSASLGVAFPGLKSMSVELSFFSPNGVTRSGQIKYVVNLDHARSVFRFDCPNKECVRGDFDLSDELARAVAARDTAASGEMCCRGWRNKDSVRKVYCRNILRYKLRLAYRARNGSK